MKRRGRTGCILGDCMTKTFNQDFFKQNRARLRERVGLDLPYALTANGVMQRNADNIFKFRQDSNFWYLTGVDEPDIIMVMSGGAEYLIVPTRDAVMETFEGKVDTEALRRISGIDEILDEVAGWERLVREVKAANKLATVNPPPVYMDFYQFYTNPARARMVERLRSAVADLELTDVREHLGAMRVVKQEAEIAMIREAVDATVEAFLYVTEPERFRTYKHEYDVEADITWKFRRAGCGHAFDPIVVCGERGVTMHATENSEALKSDGMTIIDIGAEAGLYAADVARTVMAGEPSVRQRALYDAVAEAQDYAYSLIKPGITHTEYERLNQQFVGEKLRELGIIDTVEKEAVHKHFPHMMSHFVGLEPHDVGDYKLPMQAGTVMVVEPGMYSYDEGLGVRLEDMVLVTETGYEHLSQRLPRQLVV